MAEIHANEHIQTILNKTHRIFSRLNLKEKNADNKNTVVRGWHDSINESEES